MPATVRIKALGHFVVESLAGRDIHLPTRKSRALLVYLALQPDKRFSRNHLAALLWGEEAEPLARQSLRQALSALRQIVGHDVFIADPESICCRAGAIANDAHEFERLSRIETFDAAEKANSLYGGDLLEGQETGQTPFDDWLGAERERLKELSRKNLANILIKRSNDPDLSRAIETANSLSRLDPFDESVHRTLMRLYARQGRIPRAIRHFQQFSTFLSSELDIPPDDETMQLYNELCAERTGTGNLHTLSDYAFVLEQQVHCIVVTDLASHIVGWNKAAEAQFGFSKDFMYGRTPTLIYAPKRDQSLADNLFKLACERGHWSSRVKLLSKDGRECYQTRTVAPLYNRRGVLIGGFGTGIPAR